MKNFLRALRHAWPYRRRFAVSVFCAAFAAMLWGLNFTVHLSRPQAAQQQHETPATVGGQLH